MAAYAYLGNENASSSWKAARLGREQENKVDRAAATEEVSDIGLYSLSCERLTRGKGDFGWATGRRPTCSSECIRLSNDTSRKGAKALISPYNTREDGTWRRRTQGRNGNPEMVKVDTLKRDRRPAKADEPSRR